MDECHRIRDALLTDFDATCQSVGAEIATSPDPIVLLDVILQLLVEDAQLLPRDLMDRLESELVPQVVQILLSKPFDPQCVEQINVFFQHILLKVATRLERQDATLLATLVRLMDEHRQFYVYYGCEETPTTLQQEENAQEFVTWTPYASCYLVQNIDLWGKVGGFDAMVQALASNRLSFEGIRNVFKCLFNIKDHLFVGFLKSYLVSLTKAAIAYIQGVSFEEFQSLTRDATNDIASVIQLLLARITSEQHTGDSIKEAKEIGHLVEMLQLETAFRFVQSNSLEKRINGLTDIIRLIHTSYENSSTCTGDEDSVDRFDKTQLTRIVDWIHEKEIVKELLLGSKVHSELIKRSTPIFGFLCAMEDRPRLLVDTIWQSYTSGATSRHEVLTSAIEQLILDLCALIDEEELVYFVSLVQQCGALDQFKESLLIKIALRSLTTANEESLAFTKQILLHLWKSLADVSEERTEKLVGQMAEILQHIALLEKDAAFIWECVDLCVRAIESRHNALMSLKFFTQLVSLLTNENYTTKHFRAASLLSILEAEMIEFAQQEDAKAMQLLTRLENIRTRLLAIRAAWMLACPQEQKAIDLLNSVWSVCLSRHSTSDESSLFFQWLELCLNTTSEASGKDHATHLLDQSLVEYLVMRKFHSLEPEQMSMAMLSCFHQLFRRVNLLKGGLQCFSIASEDGDSKNEQEIIDLVTGESKLVGLADLWSITIRSCDKHVAEEAMTLLTSCYIELVPSIVDSKLPSELKHEFISTCMEWLNAGVNNRQESQVNRCVDLLRYFLESTEEEEVNLVVASDDLPELEELSLGNLEDKLPYLDVYPSPMKEMGRLEPKGAVPRRRSNNAATNGQHNQVTNSQEQENDDATEGDGQVGKTSGSLSISASSESLLQSPVRSPVSGRCRPHLDAPPMTNPQHGPDLSPDDITLALNEVYASNQMTGSPQLLSLSSSLPAPPSSIWATASQKKHSRFGRIGQMIANHNEYFDTLFELVTWKEETSQRTWELLCRLPTNNSLLHQMICLRQQKAERVLWDALLDVANVHHLLYAIRLVEALLLPLSSEPACAEDSARRQWRERFVRLGGLRHLYKALLHWNLDSGSETSVYSRNLHATCLAAILRIHNYFFQFCDLDTKSKHLNNSCFDTTFLQMSLPLCLNQMDSVALFNVAARIMTCYCTGDPGSTKQLSSEAQEAVLGSLCMCCRLYALHPEFISSNDAPAKEMTSVVSCLRVVLHDCPCADTRTKAADMLSQFVSCAGPATVESFLRASTEILLASGSNNCAQLFGLASHLLGNCVVVDSMIQWIKTASVTERLLVRLASSDTSATSDWMGGCIETLAHLCRLSSDCRRSILEFTPEHQGEHPWIVEYLANSFTFANKSASKYSAPARQLLFELVFPTETTDISHAAGLISMTASFLSESLQILESTGRNWNFVPQSERKEQDGYVGLVNPGCICYMNALVQQLFMVPKFREGLLTLEWQKTSSSTNNSTDTDKQGSNDSTAKAAEEEFEQLQKLFVALRHSTRRAVDPSSFALSHRDIDGQPTDVRLQMDADEFFCLLLDRLDTFLKQQAKQQAQAPEQAAATLCSFTDECFGGVLVNQILTEQGNLSEREEKFFALSLDVSSKERLVDSLSLYVQGETLEGENAYYCEQARQKVNATKRICIKTLPHTLVLHLKRFEFDFDSMRKVKLNNFLEFPMELDMAPYTRAGLDPNKPPDLPPQWYDLVGVVVHSGTSETGHYYSFIKEPWDPDGLTKKRQARWFEFNDQVVRCFSEETLGEECFGGEEIVQKWDPDAHGYTPSLEMKRRNAYMLFYQQRDASKGPSQGAGMNEDACINTVEDYKTAILQENARFDKVLNSFGSEFAGLLAKLVQQAMKTHPFDQSSVEATVRLQESFAVGCIPTPSQLYGVIRKAGSISSRTCVAVAEYLFGLMSLTRQEDCCVSPTKVQEMTNAALDWIHRTPEKDQAALFSMWLLKQFSQSSGHENAEVFIDGQRSFSRRRSWLFDLLFLCDNLDLKDAFLRIACASVTTLASGAASKEDASSIDAQFAMNALESFMILVTELFFSRDEMEVYLHGNPMNVTAATMSSAYLQICSFFENCLMMATSSTDSVVQRVVVQLFSKKCRFLYHFLTSLQLEHKLLSDPSKIRFSSPLHRVRSCTFEVEKRLLQLMFSLTPESQWSQWFSSHERKLLVEIPLVRNLFLFGFDRLVLHKFYCSCFADETSSYQEKCVATTMNVLEKLKDSHVEDVLSALEVIVGIGNNQNIVEHVFSPTCGLLEAASYYQDNSLYRAYTTRLLRFIVERGDKCVVLQQYLQSPSLVEQVKWIGSWLEQHQDRFHDRSSSIERSKGKEDGTPESEYVSIVERAKAVFGFGASKFNDGLEDTEQQLQQQQSLSSENQSEDHPIEPSVKLSREQQESSPEQTVSSE